MESSVEHFILVVLMIPAVVTLAILGVIVIKMLLGHLERKARIRAEAFASGNGSVRAEIDSLREEMTRLRDTCTQYDVSIQHALEEMQHRLEWLETRHPAAPAAATAQIDEQVIIARRQS